MLAAKTPAVLSLNGQPQVTLASGPDGETQQQHTEPETTVSAPVLEIMRLLGALVRLRISDGRVVVGRFHCFDKHQNVILRDAREFAPTRGAIKKSRDKAAMAAEAQARDQEEETCFAGVLLPPSSRSLGVTLVPGKHIVYMKVQS